MRLPWWLRGQRVCLQWGRPRFDPWVGKTPWRRKWQPTLVLLPGKSHGWRSLVGYSPWGRKESYTTKRLHFHFSFIHSLKGAWFSGTSPGIYGWPGDWRLFLKDLSKEACARGKRSQQNEYGYDLLGASQVALVVKNPPAKAEGCKTHGLDLWVGKVPWRRAQQRTPVFLPEESHGQRSLRAAGHRVAQRATRLKRLSRHAWWFRCGRLKWQ